MIKETSIIKEETTMEGKMKKFERVKIIHPKMKQIMFELKSLIEQPSGNEIIMVLEYPVLENQHLYTN